LTTTVVIKLRWWNFRVWDNHPGYFCLLCVYQLRIMFLLRHIHQPVTRVQSCHTDHNTTESHHYALSQTAPFTSCCTTKTWV